MMSFREFWEQLRFVPSRARLRVIDNFYGISKGNTYLIHVADYPDHADKLIEWIEELRSRGIRVIAFRTCINDRDIIAIRRADSPCTLYIDVDTSTPFISRKYRLTREICTFLRYALYYSGYKLKYRKLQGVKA